MTAPLLSLLASVVACLVFVAAVAAGADDVPDFDNPKPCPNFRCPSGHSPVQKSRSKFVSTGCSKMGGGMMMMGGGMNAGKEKYASCCDRWHACYQTCGASKTACDAGFNSCVPQVCMGDEECKKAADLNTMLLNMGGCGLYDQSQYAACECAKKDKVGEKRAIALRSFYKKFVPNHEKGKVDALAKKADSAGKMAALFRKLHVKYPKSIEVKVDDEMARMQAMMRNAQEEEKNKKGDDEDGGGDTRVEDADDGEDDGDVEDMDEF
eukprot:CAMPEP_0172552660 /NCGR_PEP_ID=MMETSP1067-20121228/46646_1 /TAXON_ID=265564 ORGANISM="Thalassiosira punctigera, Strain Tpunct2005C2" /NCGR_SAMPLE_ID=MMETSP1067 /ASSEMBLY_ACC=CAM_ASM_000444 /LENGTH=265 /DNA_ID=CAMNT_0013340691 /DNA_START=132 /DNA_END=929 /DNA_ORIENTATION=-